MYNAGKIPTHSLEKKKRPAIWGTFLFSFKKNYFTSINSTSKVRSAFSGIIGGRPCSPYANT